MCVFHLNSARSDSLSRNWLSFCIGLKELSRLVWYEWGSSQSVVANSGYIPILLVLQLVSKPNSLLSMKSQTGISTTSRVCGCDYTSRGAYSSTCCSWWYAHRHRGGLTHSWFAVICSQEQSEDSWHCARHWKHLSVIHLLQVEVKSEREREGTLELRI